MSVIIEDGDVIWDMDWSELNTDGTRKYPNRPPTEVMFEVDKGLAVLLATDQIVLNTHWWEKEWPEAAQATLAMAVNCGDLFYGAADAEPMRYGDIEDVYKYYKKDPNWGTAIWCIIRRGMLPQRRVCESIKRAGVWDLDLMGLTPNKYEQ